jgi:hypothetical protein
MFQKQCNLTVLLRIQVGSSLGEETKQIFWINLIQEINFKYASHCEHWEVCFLYVWSILCANGEKGHADF